MNLSIICVFQDQQDLVEPILKVIHTTLTTDFELIVIDDGSRDGTYQQLQAISPIFDQEAITIIHHDLPIGKGLCYNKAASIASCHLLWMVDHLDQIHTDILQSNLSLIDDSKYHGLVMSEDPLYQEIETWVENINNGYLLSNEHYLWNWNTIPENQRFFNPYQTEFHGIELSIRLASQAKLIQAPLCFSTIINKNRLSTISSNRTEILMSLFRERKVNVEQSDLLLSQVKLREKKFGVDITNRNSGELIYEAKALIAEGYNSDALDICNKLQELFPENVEIITLKIQVLNRLHRYVEAAELKYEINQRYGINLSIPKATTKISLIVPDEISELDDLSLKQKKVFPPPHEQLLVAPPPERTIEQKVPEQTTLFSSEIEEIPVVPLAEPAHVPTEKVFEWDSDSDLLDEIALEIEQESGKQNPEISQPEADQQTELMLEHEEQEQPTELDHKTEPLEQPSLEVDDEVDLTMEVDEIEDIDVVEELDDDGVEVADEVEEVAEIEKSEEEAKEGLQIDSETISRILELDVIFDEPLKEEAPLITPLPERPALVSLVVCSVATHVSLIKSCVEHVKSLRDEIQLEFVMVINGVNDEITDYLESVKADYPFVLIHNDLNRGFGHSINQALDIVSGAYVCVMHNDAKPDAQTLNGLCNHLEQYAEIGLISPKLPADRTPVVIQEVSGSELSIVEEVESPCFMFRSNTPCRFDVGYHLAWFEVVDFCKQLQDQGYLISVANHYTIPHQGGATTSQLGIPKESRLYWNNKNRYEDKWNYQLDASYYLHENPIEELIFIGDHINPWQPETFFITRAKKLFTSENRTQILNMSWDYSTLSAMIKLLTVIDFRDVLRNLEEKLKSFSINESLCYRLVYYYYQRNIYSRCSYYLNCLPPEKQSARLKLILLKIALADSRLEHTISLVNELYAEYPFNPILLRIIGDLHASEGNHDDAAFFMSKANEIDPFQCVEL